MPCVMITGASRGIGLELARSFAGDGWRVQALCRQPDKAKALKALGDAVTVHRADVSDGLRIASLARDLADLPIDILINNAGIHQGRGAFGETDYDAWSEELKVNVLGPMRLAERFVEQVAASDRKLIVNVSSIMGSIASTSSGGNVVYRSSKAALNMVTRSLSNDLAERGVTVVSVHPGWVQTDMGGEAAAITPERSVADLRALIERLGPEDNGRFFNHDGAEIPW